MNEEQTIALDELVDDGQDVKQDELSEIHADQILWKIGKLEAEIDDIKYKQMESKEFYDRKIDSIDKQISYRSSLLETFMQQQLYSGKKTTKVPNGTLRMTTRTSRDFGDEKELIKFSYNNQIPTRVTEKPDKKAILEHISATGNVPKEYRENTETTFSYKTNNQQQKEL